MERYKKQFETEEVLEEGKFNKAALDLSRELGDIYASTDSELTVQKALNDFIGKVSANLEKQGYYKLVSLIANRNF